MLHGKTRLAGSAYFTRFGKSFSDLPYSADVPGEPFIELKRLNLFIGPNNSGKSRLLRMLFSIPTKELKVGANREIKAALEALGSVFEVIKANPQIGNVHLRELINIYNGSCDDIEIIKTQISGLVNAVNGASNPSQNIISANSGSHFQIRQLTLGNPPTQALSNLADLASKILNPKRYYVPILRGMRPLGDGDKDFFLERTIKDYFSMITGNELKSDLNIITGFDLYNLLVSNLLGQPEERTRIREYEKIIGDEFFGGAEVTLIPEYGKDTVSVKIGNDNQFPIYDLGDGLQQVIIITSSAFLERESSMFFIEEPEACLHPGLLRKLALFLLKHTNHQYLATTHSNHLLDLSETREDVLVHKVYKEKAPQGSSFKISECTRDRELLNELGVHASSIYLANCTIWVEGITDRLYIKAFMEKFLSSIENEKLWHRYNSFMENFHYSFVEYQGGTLGHWDFGESDSTVRLSASNVCSSALLIADGDIQTKGERAEILKKELREGFYILPCKEIENILPVEVIHKTAEKLFDRKKGKTIDGLDKERLKGILKKQTDSDLSYGIGYHLDKCLGLSGKGKGRKVFADESGTVGQKVDFCNKAIEVMGDMDWELTPAIKELCAKIFAHIAMCNH
nr:AAA family ATPase [Pseudomonas luteola]